MGSSTEMKIFNFNVKLDEDKPYKVALKYGVIFAVVFIVIDLLFFVLTDDPGGIYRQGFKLLQSLVIGIITVYLASKEFVKNQDSERLPFGRVVGIGFLIGLISGVIIGLYILFKKTYMYDSSLEIDMEIMEGLKILEESDADISVEDYEVAKQMSIRYGELSKTPFVIFIKPFLHSVFWITLSSLFVGFSIKKEIPK